MSVNWGTVVTKLHPLWNLRSNKERNVENIEEKSKQTRKVCYLGWVFWWLICERITTCMAFASFSQFLLTPHCKRVFFIIFLQDKCYLCSPFSSLQKSFCWVMRSCSLSAFLWLREELRNLKKKKNCNCRIYSAAVQHMVSWFLHEFNVMKNCVSAD